MILPTPDEIRAAKADAQQRFGRDEALLVTLQAPIDFAMLVAPLAFRDVCELTDAQAKQDSRDTPVRALVIRQRLWPSADLVVAAFDKRPAAPTKAMAQLFKRAGRSLEDSQIRTLDELIEQAPKDATEIIPGLSVARALELQGDGTEELWAVVGPGPLSMVMSTPDADVYLAARNADAKARQAQKRIVEAKLDFARSAVRWTRTPLDALLDDQPALVTDIKDAWDFISGEGADAASKSV